MIRLHLFHKWNVLHYFELDNENGWFEHRRCSVCGKTELRDNLEFFSTINDAIELGIAIGIYKAFEEQP